MTSPFSLPGYGDQETWGAVSDPGDPRWAPKPFSGTMCVYLEESGEEYLVDYQGLEDDLEIIYCDPEPRDKSTIKAIKDALEDQL
jgi:hypothetical protein